MPGMFDVPRQLTWPIGVAVTFLVLALLFTALRRRSVTMRLVAAQFWLGAITMILITVLIFATLAPREYLITTH